MKSKKNETRNDETISGKGFAAVMLALFAICYLIQITNCTPYHPGNFPSYDVLVPSEIVKENPIAFIQFEGGEIIAIGNDIKDGKIIAVDWTTDEIKDGIYDLVNDEFLQWAYDLKSEIKRLR